MSNSRKKRGRGKSHGSNIVSAAALIVIAVLLLIFVYAYISNNSFTSVFSIFSKSSETYSESKSSQDAESESAESEAPDSTGLTYIDGDKLIYVLTDAEMKLYSENSDNVIQINGMDALADSWYEDGDSLYYFGANGYAVSDYSENAMQYGFDRDFRLSSIKYNDAYIADGEQSSSDYPGVVQTRTLWAFLDTEKTLGDLCAVKYKKTTESFSHLLGGDSMPQYTSRFALSIADGYIYYAAFAEASDKLTESVANKLFRMKPGADYRELGAEDIQGYKLYESPEGKISVYYDDGVKVKKISHFEKDEDIIVFSEDASYYVDISSGKAVLYMEGSYPVTMESSAFKAGNFTYALSSTGEITAVAPKTQVNYGGYIYTVENGDSFGSKKARVIRSADDKKEVISSEFDGSVQNLHFDFASSHIIAEYTDKNGSAGLLSISLDGDVDIIYDASELGAKCTLYAINDGYAYVKTADSSEPFKKAKLAASYPLAAGIDPVDISDKEQESADASAGSTEASESTKDHAGNESAAGTKSTSETAAVPQSSSASSAGNTAETMQSPGSDSTNIINNNTPEKKGPGST